MRFQRTEQAIPTNRTFRRSCCWTEVGSARFRFSDGRRGGEECGFGAVVGVVGADRCVAHRFILARPVTESHLTKPWVTPFFGRSQASFFGKYLWFTEGFCSCFHKFFWFPFSRGFLPSSKLWYQRFCKKEEEKEVRGFVSLCQPAASVRHHLWSEILKQGILSLWFVSSVFEWSFVQLALIMWIARIACGHRVEGGSGFSIISGFLLVLSFLGSDFQWQHFPPSVCLHWEH
jgi:hypothetical protein